VEKAPEPAKPNNSKMAYKPAKQEKKPKAGSTKPTTKSATAQKTSGSGTVGTSGAKGSGTGTKGTGSGTGPGGGGITVDSQDFRFAYYLEVLRERIGYNWAPPPVFGSTSEVTATVYFKISRDGTITDEKVEKTSRHEIFDRSAVRAVRLADPLPPLPAGFKGKWLGVHFEFQHNPGENSRG
jgi:protein TonB